MNVTIVSGVVASVNCICRLFSSVGTLERYNIVEGSVWKGACGVQECGKGVRKVMVGASGREKVGEEKRQNFCQDWPNPALS